jgi:hypothetical protein
MGAMRGRLLLGLAVAALGAAPAHAQNIQLRAKYDAYAAGFQVAEMQARIGVDAATYRMRIAYHTTGLLGTLVPGTQEGGVDGLFDRTRAMPQHFWGKGVWRGEDRRTELNYRAGQPEIVALVPPNDADYEPVPDTMQAGTVDALTAMIEVLRQVALTGKCEGQATTFEGRRVVAVTTHTIGVEDLAPSSRSPYAGNALRCDFEGRQLAGFYRDADRSELEKPKPGSAWFAPVTPGGPPVPIRVNFPTRWVGQGTLYLTEIGPDTVMAGKP